MKKCYICILNTMPFDERNQRIFKLLFIKSDGRHQYLSRLEILITALIQAAYNHYLLCKLIFIQQGYP